MNYNIAEIYRAKKLKVKAVYSLSIVVRMKEIMIQLKQRAIDHRNKKMKKCFLIF